MTTQSWIRTFLVYTILFMYASMSIYLIANVIVHGVSLQPDGPFPYIYNTILGLISAVVVTELALTPPNAGAAGGSQNFGALLAGGIDRFVKSSSQTQTQLTRATQIYLIT